MGRVVLDSSVLIALYDKTDIHHEIVVRKFEQNLDRYEISTLTITEVLTAPVTALAQSKERIRQALKIAISELHPVTEEIALSAADVRVKTGLKTADAIISATATLMGAELWTLDARLAKAHKGAVLIA
jgi:predicted nucleic acid-binding protein